jgi:hypothetical protein
MSLPNHIQKTLVMKPEVKKLFEDLEEWLDYCRMELIRFDPVDLYKSKEYKLFQKNKNKDIRRPAGKSFKSKKPERN